MLFPSRDIIPGGGPEIEDQLSRILKQSGFCYIIKSPNFVIVIFKTYAVNSLHHVSFNFPDLMTSSSVIAVNYKLSEQ
jgi:hypothetical protein